MEQASQAPDLLLGANVGNYQVQRKLGEGGMGAVYLAVHPKIGKRVALKVLHPEFSSNEDVISRFFNEAKAVNDIQHPNIVDIIDYGTMQAPGLGHQVVYFIMEFLGGDSLAKIIHDQAPLAPERAQAVALQIADALSASHRHGIVHRDLKPDNVMIAPRRDGRDFVKVLDFGIAKLTGDTQGSRRTRTGIVMGTPAYMSPEQCEGRGLIDHRTDIYALGILLYEMLSGRVPFQGEGYGEVLVQHMTQVPQKPSTIRGVLNPHLEAVCMKALEKRPDNRFSNMDDFMQALADPVSYVEGHGGLERFLSYGAGASPTPYPVAPGSGPYMLPQGQVGTPPTPPPGYVGAVSQSAAPYTPSPVPGSLDRIPTNRGRMIIVGLGAIALGVAVFVGYKVLSGKSDDKKPVAGATTGPTTQQPVSSGGTTDTPPTDPAGGGAAPTSTKVKVDVASNPAGAEVFVSDVSMGKTPTSFELDRGDKPVDLVLKAEGYQDRKESVVPNTNSNLDLQLTPVKVADRDPPPGDTTKKSGGDTTKKSGGDTTKKTGGKTGSTSGKHGGKSTSAGDNTLRPN
ncbi:MAG TPA: serine/threonine-protein kinase, partial [Kofleriaceae bacterium]